MKPRIIFIGLDTAERDLLLRWSDEGKLPNLSRLRGSGRTFAGESWPGLAPSALWPSLATGRSPASTGIYFDDQLHPSAYSSGPTLMPVDRAPTIWQALSDAGKRVCVVNVPYVTCVASLNGIQVANWNVHDHTDRRISTWPPAEAMRIIERFGDDPHLGACTELHAGCVDWGRFQESLVERLEKKTDLACELLARERWDLFLMVYDETHCVGEACWHLHDASHPEHDPALVAAIGDPLERIYRVLDTGIGRLLATVDADTTVVLAALTGTQANRTGTWLLDDILLRLEARERTVARGTNLLRRAWRAVPAGLRERVPQRARASIERVKQRERAQRRFFPLLHNHMAGAIRINLAGREPVGLVHPGQEYEALCGHLTASLLALRDLDSGEPVVARVVRPADVMEGDRLGDLPDLFVEWAGTRPHSRVSSPEIGTIERRYPQTRTGDHTTHCLLVAAGPGIEPGRDIQPFAITDVAATTARYLGVSFPQAEGGAIVGGMGS